MKKWEFSVVIEKDEDGYYVGSVPELKGCHTQPNPWMNLWSGQKRLFYYALR